MHAKVVTLLILVLGCSAALQPGEADELSTEDEFFLGRVMRERSLQMSMGRAPASDAGTEATPIQGGAVFETSAKLVTPKSEGVGRKNRALIEILSVDASKTTDSFPKRLRGVTVQD